MNFFKELEAFFEWMGETETPISHSAALLWIYLLWRNNACALPTLQGQWLWRVQFYVRPELLERTLHTTYRNVARYRVELVNAGRLSYQNARPPSTWSRTCPRRTAPLWITAHSRQP